MLKTERAPVRQNLNLTKSWVCTISHAGSGFLGGGPEHKALCWFVLLVSSCNLGVTGLAGPPGFFPLSYHAHATAKDCVLTKARQVEFPTLGKRRIFMFCGRCEIRLYLTIQLNSTKILNFTLERKLGLLAPLKLEVTLCDQYNHSTTLARF